MFDVVSLVKTFGYFGIFGIVFAESGLMVGFFFPGDSLLFTAGVLASANFLNIWILTPLIFLAAVLGDNIGYFLGREAGEKLFERESSFFFRRSHAVKAKEFFSEHGSSAVVLARFVPVMRTFVPVIAGIGRMEYKKFFFFDLIGGLLWGVGLTLIGFFLGNIIPDVDRYLLPIVGVIVTVSLLPVIKVWYSAWKQTKR